MVKIIAHLVNKTFTEEKTRVRTAVLREPILKVLRIKESGKSVRDLNRILWKMGIKMIRIAGYNYYTKK